MSLIKLSSTRSFSKAKSVMAKATAAKRAQESALRYHGLFYKNDGYEGLRNDMAWQARIIKREKDIFKKWETKFSFHQKQWYD